MNKIIEVLEKKACFVISSHVAPDGDNVGSSVALAKYLQNKGKEAYYVLDDSFPANLSFIYERFPIFRSEDVQPKLVGREYVLIALDCGDQNRLKIKPELIERASIRINIDHHESNDHFGDLNYVVKDASSTCELVYHLLRQMGEEHIDEETATALYTGLCTDTGSFKYESAVSSTFRVAADLLELGAQKDLIVRSIYQSDSLAYVKMSAEVMSKVFVHDFVAVASLDQALLQKHQVDFNDLEELPSKIISISGVETGLLFKEKEKGVIKVSLRSKEWVNVSEIAAAFGGGGHIRAAGCTIYASMQEAIDQVLGKTREYMNTYERNTEHP